MRFLLTLFLSFLISQYSFSQSSIINISKDNPLIYLGDNMLIHSEGSKSSSIDDILKSPTFFKPSSFYTFVVGDDNSQTIWLKFSVNNTTLEDAIIEIDPPLADTITLYEVENTRIINQSQTGFALPFSQRAIKTASTTTLQLNGAKNKLTTYILKIESHLPYGIKIRVGSRSAFEVSLENDMTYIGIFIGFMLMVVLLNILMYSAQKEIMHIWYSVYLLSMVFVVCYNYGYLHKWFFYDTPQYNAFTYVLVSIPGIFAIQFSIEFLEVKTLNHRLYRFLKFTVLISVINLFIAFLGYAKFSMVFSYLVSMPITLLDIYIAYVAFKNNNKSAILYLSGWIAMLVGIGIYIADNLNILHNNMSMKMVMLISISIEALFLTIGVIIRIGDLRKEKDGFQAMLIQTLEQNKKIVAEQNHILEHKINERTEELVAALKREQEKEELLKSSNKELTEFAHIVSHDMKAPLRNIASFIQLFNRKNKAKYDDLDREYMEFVVTSVKQSSSLIDDLLNYSKLDKNIGNPVPVKLNDNIFVTIATLSNYIEDRNAQVIVNDLPVIKGHDSLLKLLFQNLIINGIKYNESQKPTVEVGVTMHGQECIYWVKDNGIGIPPQYQEEVFRMFRRLHTADKYEGSGIGLAFCKRIIDTYEGRIWFESEKGCGTTFMFTLPKAPVISQSPINQQFIQDKAA